MIKPGSKVRCVSEGSGHLDHLFDELVQKGHLYIVNEVRHGPFGEAHSFSVRGIQPPKNDEGRLVFWKSSRFVKVRDV